MDKEKLLRQIDFSRFSKVQGSLRAKLLAKHQSNDSELSLNELDYIIAAGTGDYDLKNDKLVKKSNFQ